MQRFYHHCYGAANNTWQNVVSILRHYLPIRVIIEDIAIRELEDIKLVKFDLK